MIEINLLPKDYLKRTSPLSLGKAGVYGLVAAVGFAAALTGLTFYQMSRLRQLDENIERASQRAAMLQKDIKLVDGLLDIKNKITRRMAAVEELDRHRTVWVRILENLASNMPEFVWLSSFTEKAQAHADGGKGDKGKNAQKDEKAAEKQAAAEPNPETNNVRQVEVEGYAFTLNSLAAFMIKMMRSDYFDKVELVSSNEAKLGDDNEKAYQFVLTCDVHYLSDEDLRNLIAQRDSTSSDSLALEPTSRAN